MPYLWVAYPNYECSRCSALSGPAALPQSALSSRSTSTRMRVWSLINNVSIADDGHMQCSWPDGNVTYPTSLLGAVVHTYGPGARLHTQGAVASPLSPEAIVLGHADAASTSRSSAGAAPPARSAASSQFDAGSPDAAAFGEDFALSFGYKPSLFQLPMDVQDKFLHIQNVTLLQLPQMSPGRKLLRGFRRLLNVESSADAGIWTMLLWPVRRWVGFADCACRSAASFSTAQHHVTHAVFGCCCPIMQCTLTVVHSTHRLCCCGL
jgi:hypothetical protein